MPKPPSTIVILNYIVILKNNAGLLAFDCDYRFLHVILFCEVRHSSDVFCQCLLWRKGTSFDNRAFWGIMATSSLPGLKILSSTRCLHIPGIYSLKNDSQPKECLERKHSYRMLLKLVLTQFSTVVLMPSILCPNLVFHFYLEFSLWHIYFS